MKTHILFFAFFLTLVSCSTNDDSNENVITVNGRVERQINGEGLSGQTVSLSIKKTFGTPGDGIAFDTTLDSKEVITDSDGNFSVSMNNGNDENTYVEVHVQRNDEYTGSSFLSFGIDKDVLLKINKFIEFKIFVNNDDPFDENDFINIDFYTGFVVLSTRTGIENFGVQNIIIPPQSGGIGEVVKTSWEGTDVNSIVYYKVSERADEYKIKWTKIKNGIETTGFTDDIPFTINQVNEYNFNY